MSAIEILLKWNLAQRENSGFQFKALILYRFENHFSTIFVIDRQYSTGLNLNFRFWELYCF